MREQDFGADPLEAFGKITTGSRPWVSVINHFHGDHLALMLSTETYRLLIIHVDQNVPSLLVPIVDCRRVPTTGV